VMPPRIAHRRHVVDHIAERGRLDEEDVGHAAGFVNQPNNRFFNEMPVGSGPESRYGRTT
jgi:hypothetical protein